MNTILYIKEILSFFFNKDEINEDVYRELVLKICKLLEKFPHLLHPICNPNISENDALDLVEKIRIEACNSFVPIFPSHLKYVDVIGDKVVETPIFNRYDELHNQLEAKHINEYLLNIILAMPINKVKLTFVELGEVFIGDYFYKNINSKIYHNNPITDEYALKDFLSTQKNRIIDIKKQYGNYFEYCLKNKTIPIPYEIIVVSENHTSWFSSYKKELESLIVQGKEAGLYVIQVIKENRTKLDWFALNYKFEGCDLRSLINKMDASKYVFNEIRIKNINIQITKHTVNLLEDVLPNKITRDDINYNNQYLTYRENSNSDYLKQVKNVLDKYHIDYKDIQVTISDLSKEYCAIIECRPITEKNNLLNACIQYINSEADKKKKAVILTQDFEKSASNTYENNLEAITVPIGKSSNTEVNFTMDMVSHVHSFIIGQSGSGKSVFLHNIMGSAILKYAPEDLQLYLLDFKLGGVEFNRYKGIKHVKSLLVDNSDQQITLEILRELRERMVERGRQLRDCGVNNLVEYNKQNPNATMPQILLVVDECHEMFRVGSDIPRTVSNEISEIITKIAKEGRSQGVHLILATQTLSGTEISNEILNNVSDHYLLKCAPVDSERMVERSSEITSQLSTGQIYYHHVDNQVQFQAYYTDKENAEKLIDLAKKKAENHQSNGEFYFNGSQLFKLDETVMEQGKKRAKYPVAYMGKNISISQNDLSITLRKDYSENILLFGLNDVEQVTRTTMNLFISLISYTQSKRLDYKFKVFNCLSNEDSIYTEQLEMLEEEGYCEIIEGRKDRGKFLKQLAEDISNETAENTILLILGQERFRELKMDMEITQEQSKPSSDDAFGFGDFSFSNEGTSSSSIKTFKQALELILDKGPEFGVHTIMQLDKPSNFLFSDYISPKMVYQKFKHLIMLKSDEAASAQLHLNDNIRLETLSKDLERLRAYYYSEESDTYTLFTPYMELSNEEIMNLLKTE